MKSSVQMQVAKHMLAIWMKPTKSSLIDSFSTIDRTWPQLSRRVLRTWAKSVNKNPESYPYTGLAFKRLNLEDYFTPEEVDKITRKVDDVAPAGSHHRDIYRLVIINKWVYGQIAEIALEAGLHNYYGEGYKCDFNTDFSKRPPKPVLKP